jgi:uncharacterized protein
VTSALFRLVPSRVWLSVAGPVAFAVPVAAWPAAVVVGISLGLLGSGGSILTVPLLQFIVGLRFEDAKATSFPIVGGVALIAIVGHLRRGTVRPRAVLPFVVASVPCSFVAARWIAPLLSGPVQATAFAAAMFVAAYRMAFHPASELGDDVLARRPVAEVLAFGAGVGLMTGLLGVGGGFLIVPALVLGLRLDVRTAMGTSLLVIALNCASSLLATVLASAVGAVHWDLAAVFILAGAVGVYFGARVASHLSPRRLRLTFAIVVVVIAVVLVVNAWT